VSPERHLLFEQAYLSGFKDLTANDRHTARRLMAMVNSLARNPEPEGCIHLGDSLSYRLHLGDYRVLYFSEPTRPLVCVLSLATRGMD
jgi:mRNA-degrading endonuclease RelE of RelBE toxin-antitoxin system